MPEWINRDTAPVIFSLAAMFIAGHIHGARKVFRWGIEERREAEHWKNHAADLEGHLYAAMKAERDAES